MPIHVHRKKIKHMYVRIKESGCHFSVPKLLSHQIIEHYITFNETKLLKSYQKLQSFTFTLWGKNIDISYLKAPFSFRYTNNHLNISHPDNFDLGFKLFLKLELEKYVISIEETTHHHLKAYGIKPAKIVVKYYKSKYGSYHRIKNTITLNSYLCMLDPLLIKYVIMHEYAHTKEFHHQPSFYFLQHQLCPDDKELSKRLKSLTIPTTFTL
jgi:predicted metal-dependent hydrolase